MPKVSNMDSRGENVNELVSNAIAYTSVLSVPILFGTLALGETLVVTFYSTEYSAAGTYLVGLALYQTIHSQSRVYSAVISGIDRPEVNLRLRVAAVVVNVVAGVALIFEVGGIGVVVATVLAEAVKYGGSVAFLKSELPSIPVAPRPLVMQFVAGGAMYAALRVVSTRVSFSSFVAVGVVVAIGAAIYFLVLFSISREVRITAFAISRDLVSS
jgi:O-antigen/teichoic acid export membrane protein